MRNTIPRNKNGMLALMLACQNGAAECGDAIGIKHHTPDVIRRIRGEAVVARDNYEVGKNVLRDLRKTFRGRLKAARTFATLARDLLKPKFGSRYSQVWDTAGFIGAVAVPKRTTDLLALLEMLASYFAANPTEQVAGRGITDADARALWQQLSDDLAALNAQEAATDDLLREQSKKFGAVTKCLRGVIKELATLIEPLDGRWLSFGLNKPGADKTPEPPSDLRVEVSEANATLTWKPSENAEYYRLWKQVEGVDVEPVAVAHRTDQLYVFENLPSTVPIKLFASAVNSGGESRRSEAVMVTISAAVPPSPVDIPAPQKN